MQKTIYYATGNAAKFAQGRKYLSERLSTITLSQYTDDIPEQQTHDQQMIAQEKALAAWQQVQQPLLADDAGVYFDAYPNFPGFMTRYAYDALGLSGLLKLLTPNNRATIKVFLAYVDEQGALHSFVGASAGRIIEPATPIPPHVGNPFDYCFIPDGFNVPLSAIDPQIRKSGIFFREKALDAFASWYANEYPTNSTKHAGSGQVL